VKDYVLSFKETELFIDKLTDMLIFLMPNYLKEGKRQLIISIGCTGGRHRSVAIANEMNGILADKGVKVNIEHRDINEDIYKSGNKL
jgi:UPF0042 nucleotide-binding protein